MSAYDTYSLRMRTAADRRDYINVRILPLFAFLDPRLNMEELEQLYEMSDQLLDMQGHFEGLGV